MESWVNISIKCNIKRWSCCKGFKKFLNTALENSSNLIPKEEIYSKASRLDVEVTTDTGTIVNVEMQCVDTGDLDSSAVTYASKLVGQYTEQSAIYDDPNVISIWIIRDPITHGPMAERNCPIENAFVHLEESPWCNKCTKLSNRFKIIFVHLSRFKYDKLLEPLSELMIEWARFFINKPENVSNSDKGINDAQHIWVKLAGDKVVKEQIKAIKKLEQIQTERFKYYLYSLAE